MKKKICPQTNRPTDARQSTQKHFCARSCYCRCLQDHILPGWPTHITNTTFTLHIIEQITCIMQCFLIHHWFKSLHLPPELHDLISVCMHVLLADSLTEQLVSATSQRAALFFCRPVFSWKYKIFTYNYQFTAACHFSLALSVNLRLLSQQDHLRQASGDCPAAAKSFTDHRVRLEPSATHGGFRQKTLSH